MNIDNSIHEWCLFNFSLSWCIFFQQSTEFCIQLHKLFRLLSADDLSEFNLHQNYYQTHQTSKKKMYHFVEIQSSCFMNDLNKSTLLEFASSLQWVFSTYMKQLDKWNLFFYVLFFTLYIQRTVLIKINWIQSRSTKLMYMQIQLIIKTQMIIQLIHIFILTHFLNSLLFQIRHIWWEAELSFWCSLWKCCNQLNSWTFLFILTNQTLKTYDSMLDADLFDLSASMHFSTWY